MKQTKVVVFDFDGTIYSGIDWSKEWSDYCKFGMRLLFSTLSDDQFDILVRSEKIDMFTSNQIVSALKKYGKKASDWIHFRQTHDCFLDYSNCVCVSNHELHKFADKYTLYLVSNSIPKEIQRVVNYFSIDMNVFKEIITNDYEHGPDKQFYYEEIIKKEGILPEQLYVIGDSESTDIAPARRIGAKFTRVQDANFKIEDFGL